MLASIQSPLLWKPTALSVDPRYEVTSRSSIPSSVVPTKFHTSVHVCPLKSNSPSFVAPGATVIRLAFTIVPISIEGPVNSARAVASSGVVQYEALL